MNRKNSSFIKKSSRFFVGFSIFCVLAISVYTLNNFNKKKTEVKNSNATVLEILNDQNLANQKSLENSSLEKIKEIQKNDEKNEEKNNSKLISYGFEKNTLERLEQDLSISLGVFPDLLANSKCTFEIKPLQSLDSQPTENLVLISAYNLESGCQVVFSKDLQIGDNWEIKATVQSPENSEGQTLPTLEALDNYTFALTKKSESPTQEILEDIEIQAEKIN